MRRTGTVCVVVLVGALGLAAPAAAQVQPYGTDNFAQFWNILPPGESGFDNAAQLAVYEATHQQPPNFSDQLGMYSSLTTAAPNISSSEIGRYFKDATFGVKSAEVIRSESPEAGVTIRWDRFAVPHIYGDTRAELEYGIGWATAESRLFEIDVLRHVGEGTLASFAGGSNVSLDESTWTGAPYTEQDYQNQISWAQGASPYSGQIRSDAENYLAGVNAYIRAAQLNPLLMPGEYPALGYPLGPQPFTLKDFIAIATIIGSELGNGGGAQLQNALLYESLERKFGRERYSVAGSPQLVHSTRKPKRFSDHSGFATFAAFDSPNDPGAPTTVHGRSFPYQTLPMPSRATLKTIALPDPGTVRLLNPVVSGTVPGPGALARRPAAGAGALVDQQLTAARAAMLAFPHHLSNALLVSAKHSASGHPLAVMGPQVSYFAPAALMDEDIHGPGIDANGASFPGTNLYVELGHGTDYAWSATSSGQNIIDTFAVPLCNPGGGRVPLDSDYYLLKGRCTRMQTLTHAESWKPNLADSTPAGSVQFEVQRTGYGIVIARARIHGRPVAYSNLRTTYMHEVDSVVGFYLFNDPSAMRRPQQFFNAAYNIAYTFNWLFANTDHIAYFDSGLNPVRSPHTDPLFPTWARYAWRGLHPAAQLTPSSLTEQQTAEAAHPHVSDQSYLTSWNNKQAPGYGDPATGQEFSSVYRSQLLDDNIHAYLARGHGKMSLADLINAMGNAGTQDLRAVAVLPYALKVIGHPRKRTLAQALSELRAWVASGAHRINREHPGASGNYEHSDAVRIMDAWWPLWVRAEFEPVLGRAVLAQLESDFPINDEPGRGTTCCHVGSAFDVGFYGIVQTDLRDVLGGHVPGALNRLYCGQGSLARCRKALEASLLRARAVSPPQVYPKDSYCAAGDQMCSDSIQFRPIGVVAQPGFEWINRPTFQQADDFAPPTG
jgi:acyl-homoserine lactone acylase PvdQ